MLRLFVLLLCASAIGARAEGQNPIDPILKSYWLAHAISVPSPVADTVFARRVYLDIWGLLPTPEQLAAFEKDTRTGKRVRLIETLLANRQNYSEHWISFWNDLLRNDEGVNYAGARQTITKWLAQALEDNLPYDRFVTALLNPVKPEDPAGFLIGVNWRGDVSASQTPPLQAAQNSAQVFLGVNLKCNSCHDSFISKWKLKDAYGLASFFSEDELEIYRCDVKTGEKSAPRFLYPELGGADPNASLAERHAAAAHLFTSPENVRFPRTFVNRIWKKLFGRGLVEPLDDMDRAAWSPDLLNALAQDFVSHNYDIQFLLQRIMTSQAYQLPAVASPRKDVKEFVFRGPLLRRMTAEQYVDAISSITGEWRVLQPKRAGAGAYSREWRLKSTALSRTLGRPIRDQVFTDRDTDATTLQALEMVNGETMENLLRRGSQRLLGELKLAPANLFDSGVVGSNTVPVDVDVTGIDKLWLLIEDADSYDVSRVIAGWVNPELISPNGTDMLPLTLAPLKLKGHDEAQAFIAPVPAQTVLDLAGKNYTRFRAIVGIDESSQRSDISPKVRFFLFSAPPDKNQLVRVDGDPPVAFPPSKLSPDRLVARLYRHAFGRDPQVRERRIALEFFKPLLNSGGLEDLLWSIFLSPEFQYIQ